MKKLLLILLTTLFMGCNSNITVNGEIVADGNVDSEDITFMHRVSGVVSGDYYYLKTSHGTEYALYTSNEDIFDVGDSGEFTLGGVMFKGHRVEYVNGIKFEIPVEARPVEQYKLN